MAAPRETPVCWHFDSVAVDTATFRVLVNGVPQPLEPKSFRLLQFLIEHRDRVVSKEEIFQAIWAGTFVSDNALTRAVAQIRKAIGDDPRQPRYIETLPTVGYRFVAAVEASGVVPGSTAPASPAEPDLTTTSDRPRRMAQIALAIVCVAAVALAGWLWLRHPDGSQRQTPASFLPVQFSSSAGLDMGASFSPDGKLVAYASDKTGSFEIFVKSFDPAARELQLTSDGNQNLFPAFSPDGRWVAYTSARRRGIFRVPAIGGPVQRLTDFGIAPVWSPDSRTVVFRSSGSASLSTTDYYWPAESSLWTVPADGGEPAQITGTDAPPSGGQSFPSFSPDGADIRFVNYSKGEASLWAYRIADRSARKLFGSTTFPYSNATFAPDGTRMWFVSWQLNGNIGIWQLALDPTTLSPIGEPEALYRSAFAVPRDLALSADGKRLAFSAVLSDSAVLMQHLAGDATPVSLTNETTYRYGLVRSSADGSRVMYESFPRNGLSRGWIAMADGSSRLAVGSSDAAQYYNGLSRDNGVAFFVESRIGELRLISQRLADGELRKLSGVAPGTSQLTWSYDGSRVAFHDSNDDRRQVYLQDTATGTRRVIASGPEDVGFPRFSRDDKWISVEITHRPRGGDDIGVMPADGGPVRVILKSDEPTYAAGWMPDNDRILFTGFRDGAWNIYTVSRATGKTERLTTYTSLRTYVRYPDWLIGDRIAYEFNETKGNIFVADLSR
jgi:Tol biopolymer transport system component/DNA-binding winged helix-turn-helix (wHTH) protein